MQIGSIIEAAGQYVKAQYQQHPHPDLVYHNLEHTQQVVQAAEQIAIHYRLQEQDLLVVMVAAWFHDMGYLMGNAREHEEKGAAVAREFLQQQQVPEAVQQQVAGCIMATKMPQSPHNLLEEIVCDADLFHLGSKHYKERSKLMRQEAATTFGKELTSATWAETSLLFLENHEYFTDYCRVLLKQQKAENIKWLKRKLEKKQEEAGLAAAQAATLAKTGKTRSEKVKAEKTKEEKPDKEKKQKRPERGVETMFRTTSTNHIRLSSMADSKAHIMISTNAIIISILLSVLLRKLEDNPNLILPSFLLLATSVVTIIYSVLATRPNVTNGRFTRDDIERKTTNLLFFGNFHGMTLDEYRWGMTEMMKDANFLYGSMIQDIYHLGVVLGHKYRLLRIAYNIFMFGLIISVLAFIIAVVFFPVKD
ncbi:Pycsar system effector family protein [Chitinophaga japonensis]|uniref:Putative nucleotidyltransferase with HDIG domain n=1 Tax=Chitinophaga japonensis TaxID=104662 RepID=A0A562TFY2_CHIJA|nr:Pycsar system effector family protein [Chitinophaga japonensis]TWI92415.1 putative nucleotidyltransferase with HDIG domain [Chitinophaga japonensis]